MSGLAEVPAGEWDGALAARGVDDAYLRRAYLTASAVLTPGEPVLLAGAGGVFALLLRSDPTDAITPYGYGGPVGDGGGPAAASFGAAYAEWCAARGVVSSFAVTHPLLDNAPLPGFAMRELGRTIAWDLAEPRATIDSHHRRVVRRAERAGLTVAVRERVTDLDEFVALYEATMRRAGANPFYFFPPAYWDALAPLVVEVRVTDADGALMAAALGLASPPRLHYHLGGSADEARRNGAMHLALLGLAEWGAAHGCAVLHLGGGVGGRADSLFDFKRRFAPDGERTVWTARAVHDEARYRELSGREPDDLDGFFPAYREGR